MNGSLTPGLAEKGFSGIDVDCGKKVRTAEEDDTFDCEGTDDKKVTKTIAITVKDEEGNINWTVK